MYNSANMFSISLGVEQTSGGDIPIRLRYGGECDGHFFFVIKSKGHFKSSCHARIPPFVLVSGLRLGLNEFSVFSAGNAA